MTETISFDFPGYRLQSMVGRGGMGRVYRAEQLATHRTVAVKVLDRGTTDPAKLAAFRREAATVAQLEHPHVVPLYDYGDYQGTQYLVFRFLTGGTVADRIRAGADRYRHGPAVDRRRRQRPEGGSPARHHPP